MSLAEVRRVRRPLAFVAVAACAAVGAIAGAAPAHADEVYPRPSGGVMSLDGHGWGHGHGLSQYGAYGAAQQGLTWQQIIAFYYNKQPVISWGNPTIRVSVPSASGSGSTAAVAEAPGLTASFGDGKTPTGVLRSTTSTGVAITQWAVFGGTGKQAVLRFKMATGSWSGAYRTDTTGRINLYNPTSGYVDAGRGPYRGTLSGIVTSSSSTAVTSVLSMTMDNYLRRVVPSESPASWPAAALQAQAVAARSYAGYYVYHPYSSYYDICGTDRCQVFGASPEYASSDSAVATTSGKVVDDGNGKPAFTEFSSSNGGWAADGGHPWAVAHPDPYDGAAKTSSGARANPNFLWSQDVNVRTFENAWSIGSFLRLRITARDGNGDWGGRITQAVVEGSQGNVTVSGDTLRSVLGLKSNWFVPTNAGSAPSFPRDLTGDRRADVVGVVASTGALRLYPGNGTGGWQTATTIGTRGWGSLRQVFTAGTWDGDARSDVMGERSDGTLWLYPASTSGGLLSPHQIGSGWGGFNAIFTVGDFDGDGYTDLLARRASDGALFLYPGNGSGGFRTARQIGHGWGGFTTVLSPGDFTGDGHPDVLARTSNGTLYLYPGTGAGGFQSGRVIGSGWAQFTALVSPGDFDGDGKADVLARTSGGALRAYRGNGTGGWLGYRTVGSGWNGISTVLP